MKINFEEANYEERIVFAKLLVKFAAATCKQCGDAIRIEGCYNSDGSTEYGTDFSFMSIACMKCGATVVGKNSWVTEISTVGEFIDALEEEWSR